MDSPSPAAVTPQRREHARLWSYLILLIVAAAAVMSGDVLMLRLFVCTLGFLGFATGGHLLLVQRDHAQRLEALEQHVRGTKA